MYGVNNPMMLQLPVARRRDRVAAPTARDSVVEVHHEGHGLANDAENDPKHDVSGPRVVREPVLKSKALEGRVSTAGSRVVAVEGRFGLPFGR